MQCSPKTKYHRQVRKYDHGSSQVGFKEYNNRSHNQTKDKEQLQVLNPKLQKPSERGLNPKPETQRVLDFRRASASAA